MEKLSETNPKNELHTGQTIRTFKGHYVDVFCANHDTIDIDDIAHALSHMCRFAGHTPKFYSVAQHCVECLTYDVPKELQLTLLMHDATEAYLLDIPRPIKRHLRDYKELEENLMKVIADKFNLVYPFPPIIKEIDSRMLEIEHYNIILGKAEMYLMSPELAKSKFLEAYHTIQEGVLHG
jgi:uncharacterized protein